MTLTDVMLKLESLGTAQNRKIYARHGGGTNMFGVSWAEIRKLAKAIKRDHALALELWETGNFEARVIATIVADPAKISPETAEALVREMTGHGLTDELVNNLIVRAPYAAEKAAAWIEAPEEYVGRAGWHLVGGAAKAGLEGLDYAGLLARIEAAIHSAPNRKREAMNNALIAMGIYRPDLTDAALAAAGRIGKVEIDHGETDCKTPAAAEYIQKAIARRK